ncbi:Flp family type IVb pilin [Marinobacterium arenosum]|uniref:Flp family type IVb pilin n=1 Tax=Marinobacterium arenosum TaxID=2862496 RepID=UPI001C950F3B|nr:pilus assembly protein [Marinobacterium arenosum]MBY4675730.1 pilus assembly protein [Marinobacterium arenosum]
MKAFKTMLIGFLKEEEGLTTVEYAVAGSLVAAVTVAAFTTLGENVCGTINFLADVINPNVGGAAAWAAC